MKRTSNAPRVNEARVRIIPEEPHARGFVPAYIWTPLDTLTEHRTADESITLCGITYESLPENDPADFAKTGEHDKPWYYDHDRDDVVRCTAGCFGHDSPDTRTPARMRLFAWVDRQALIPASRTTACKRRGAVNVRKGHYTVEGWRHGECVHFASAKVLAAVVRHVERSVVDMDATITHVTYYPWLYAPRGVEVAQVTNALIWKWSNRPEAKALRTYVETER